MAVDQQIKTMVDEEWGRRLGLDPARFVEGGVQIIVDHADTDHADTDQFEEVVSIFIDRTCLVRVPVNLFDAAHAVFSDLTAEEAFTADALAELLGERGDVLGLSWHHYGDERSLNVEPDAAACAVNGADGDLRRFLESHSIEDWAESGFPLDPASADPSGTSFWLLRQDDRVVAAGNLTEWRGVPTDVGVLVDPAVRGHGLARRLTGAMVAAALPTAGVVRYRALSTNVASLAVADRLGFERYGGNYLARRPSS